jgi:hypothetical protein
MEVALACQAYYPWCISWARDHRGGALYNISYEWLKKSKR